MSFWKIALQTSSSDKEILVVYSITTLLTLQTEIQIISAGDGLILNLLLSFSIRSKTT